MGTSTGPSGNLILDTLLSHSDPKANDGHDSGTDGDDNADQGKPIARSCMPGRSLPLSRFVKRFEPLKIAVHLNRAFL